MTQTPSSGNGAIPGAGSPEIGTPPGTGEIPAATLPQSIDDALKEVERLRADLKKVHAESAGHRQKLKTFEDAQAKADADKLSETEKLQKQLNDLQAAREADIERLISAEIRMKAAEMGFNQKILHRLPGMINRSEIETDKATGEPTNVDKLLKSLKEEFQDVPGFFNRTTPTSGGATNPSRTQSSSVGEITRDTLTEAMSHYNELSASQKEQVHQLLINRY